MTTRIVTALCLAAALLATAPTPAAEVPEGISDGIKVHGHWKIEVFEPDGTLVSSFEFENALVSTGGIPLANTLSGYTTGGWVIQLTSPNDVSKPCETSGIPQYCFLVQNGCVFPCESHSSNLTATVPAGNGTLILAGSVTASYDSTISLVGTSVKSCGSDITPLSCRTSATGFTVDGFTLKSLDPAVPVLAGQIIQVTVTISFS